MSNYNSPEYRAIKKCSPDLATAVEDDLTPLSGELSAAGLIARGNVAGLQNQLIDPAQRAARLVGYVLNGVSLNTDNYHSFVGVLKNRKNVCTPYENILEILDKKFRELGGRYPLPKPSESYKDDDKTLPPASKKAKTVASSLSTRDPSNVTTVIDFDAPKVIDFDEVDSTSTTQNKAEVSSSGTKNIKFWCTSFTDQQLQYQPPAVVPSEAEGAAFLHGVHLWDEPKITVAITHESIRFLRKWNRSMDKDILELANKWHTLQDEPNHNIPEFIPHASQFIDNADIIVELNENGANYTIPGNAGKAGSNDPTMWLDLSSKNVKYNQFVVVHEFGHALGLGHEHQRSDFRPCLIPYLDKTKMKQTLKDLGVPEERCKDWDPDTGGKLDLTRATEYDPKSVMHYWFKKEWLKFGLDDKNQIENFYEKEIITEKVKNALLAVHDCDSGALPTEPSAKDLKLVNEEYGKNQA